jgi:hypothetical protein
LPEHSSGLLTTLLNCQRHSMHNGTAHRADRAAGRRDEDTGRDVIRLFREKGLGALARLTLLGRCSAELAGQVLDAVDEAGQQAVGFARGADVGHAGQQLAQHGADLAPGQVRA